MVSFSIFLLAAVIFYGLLANTRRADLQARQLLTANAYARQLMEAQRLKGYPNLKIGSTQTTRTIASERADGARTSNSSTVGGAFALTSTITVTDGPGPDVRSVLVEVAWRGGKVQLQTYVTQ